MHLDLALHCAPSSLLVEAMARLTINTSIMNNYSMGGYTKMGWEEGRERVTEWWLW